MAIDLRKAHKTYCVWYAKVNELIPFCYCHRYMSTTQHWFPSLSMVTEHTETKCFLLTRFDVMSDVFNVFFYVYKWILYKKLLIEM